MELNPRGLDVLGDPTRRAIVDRLRRGPSPVGRLAEGMPVSRPAVSQHLTVLKTAGIVSEHREGTRRIYRLEPAGIDELLRWVEALAVDAHAGDAAADRSTASPAGPAGGPVRGASRAGRAIAAKASGSDATEASIREGATEAQRSSAAKDHGSKKKRGKKRAGKK